MDTAVGDSSEFGLNIVAVPAAPAASSSPKKKGQGKKNKFERRRQKAKAASRTAREKTKADDDVGQQQRQEIYSSTTSGSNSHLEPGNQESDPPTTTPNNAITVPVLRPLEKLQDVYPEEEERITSHQLDHRSNNSTEQQQHLPQNEQERAAYLAEFHARPLELDRRAGAARKFAASKQSHHLFSSSIQTWSDCALHDRFVQALQSKTQFDLSQPTVVQTKAIPAFFGKQQHSAAGVHNILLHSETGSGKTLAYLLPIIQSIVVENPTNRTTGEQLLLRPKVDRHTLGTRCLVLCPTRELAAQTFQVTERLCTATFNWVVPGALLGEENRKSEKARLRKGLAIIVATPGRFLDHLQKTESLLMALKGKLEWLVLDEADRLLDMGLGSQVKQIVQRIRANQPGSGPHKNGITWRSVLVSATVTKTVEELAKETMVGKDSRWEWVRGDDQRTETANSSNMSKTAEIETETELAHSTPRQLAQVHMTVSAKFRLAALVALLVKRIQRKERAVVFLDTCASVDYHYALFTTMESIMDQPTEEPESGIFGSHGRILKLHGSVSHTERQQTIRQFLKQPNRSSTKDSDSNAGGSSTIDKGAVLLATDVAARGLNLQNCDWTIQYDPPSEISDYVHRAGRVARAGRAGHSLLFLLPSERPYLDILKKRGIQKLAAVSLASTLDAAAKVCPVLTRQGVSHSGGGLGQRQGVSGGGSSSRATRAGEAFGSEVQRRCEACVKQNEEDARQAYQAQRKADRKAGKRTVPLASHGELLELARKAFLSHIRAYPTREKTVKHIFSARALHLGHMARAFALSEPPKRLASKASASSKSSGGADDDVHDQRKRSAALAFSDLDDDGGERQSESKAGGVKRSKHSPSSGHPEMMDTKNNRALMIANAAKLNGLDSL